MRNQLYGPIKAEIFGLSTEVVFRPTSGEWGRKNFSHRRINFPSALGRGGSSVCIFGYQRPRELEAHQVIALRVDYSNSASAQRTGSFRERRGSRQGGAWDLKHNLSGGHKRPPNSHQRAASGDVQRGCKFKEFLALIVPGADEYRDRKWQSWPSPAFRT